MQRRRGFTITELLVSMALIMLIMAVMAEAFTKSLETFSAMKAIGDMDQKIRAAVVILARDLSDDHFDQPYRQLNSIPNPLLFNPPPPATQTNPSAGFFVIFQQKPPAPGVSDTPIAEGSDPDGNPYVRTSSTGTGLLHFTVNRAKSWNNNVNIHVGRRENYFAAAAPAGVASLSRFTDGFNYYSQKAEVAYFLRPQVGDTTPPTANNPTGLQRFTLFRRQAVILTDPDVAQLNPPLLPPTLGNVTDDLSWSWNPPPPTPAKTFNRFSDVIMPNNRRLLPSGSYTNNGTNGGPIPTYAEENPTLQGNDILLTDVLSFDIQVMRSDVTPYTFQTVNYFDTGVAWNNATTPWIPAPVVPAPPSVQGAYNIKAIQITIRVWDIKTQSTRQITIVQDT